MRIASIASEVDPFAKTGGLADVTSALAKAVASLGHEVRLIMPLYRQVDRARFALRLTRIGCTVSVGPVTRDVRVWEGVLSGSTVRVYFIDQPALFDRDGLYQAQGQDHPDNLERFSLFSQAALAILPLVQWQPEIIHCHDWQAALTCVHLATGSAAQQPFFASTGTVMTIHNLAFQGVFPRVQWPLTQLPPSAFQIEGLEFYGQLNCLKGALFGAGILTTVSPTYAREIQTQAFGCGLEGVLRKRRDDLVGILNGIDLEEWDPRTDPHIAAHFSIEAMAGKALCKQALQQSQRLPERHDLVIGMVQRLAEQKGIDILLEAIEALTALPIQVVLLGTGDPAYHEQLEHLAKQYPQRLAVNLTFDNAVAHQIEAGADAFLMPSRFEPCGLNQLYSMRYGTVPIVRRVGGLADTVVDVTPAATSAGTATGFVFDEYSAAALVGTVKRVLATFGDHALWGRLMQAGMRQDFSWEQSARAYVTVYERALAKKSSIPQASNA